MQIGGYLWFLPLSGFSLLRAASKLMPIKKLKQKIKLS
jgi:hypothetical protein